MELTTDALLSYTHITSIIFMGAALYTQLRRFKVGFDLKDALAIQRADLLFGITSILILITGFWRALAGTKEASYYFQNPIFHLKLTLFVLIGVLSIYPTVVFLKWRKTTKNGEVPTLSEKEFKILKRIIFAEFHLFIFIPLLAAFIARGIGL